jgi:hypothetical protein
MSIPLSLSTTMSISAPTQTQTCVAVFSLMVNMTAEFYERVCIYIYPIFMSIFKRWGRFNFEIHEVGHPEYLTVDRDHLSLKE